MSHSPNDEQRLAHRLPTLDDFSGRRKTQLTATGIERRVLQLCDACGRINSLRGSLPSGWT